MYDFFHHLGMAYQAGRVLQDSGLWLYDPKSYATYFEAWTEERKAAKGR